MAEPQHNPYAPPKTPLAHESRRTSRFMLAGLCVIAFLIAASYLPFIFRLVRLGALHPVALLVTALAAGLVLLGGGFVWFRKRRAAAYSLGTGTALAIGGWFCWASLFSLAFVGLAALGFGLSLRR